MYRLIFSKLWYSDLDSSYKYIRDTLERPMAADNLIIESKKKLIAIMNNPTHRPLVIDKYLASLGYRLQQVKNYLIFYIIGEPAAERVTTSEGSRPVDNKHIKIVRYLYCKRNWIEILKDINLEELFDES